MPECEATYAFDTGTTRSLRAIADLLRERHQGRANALQKRRLRFFMRLAFFAHLPFKHLNYSPRLLSQQTSLADKGFEGSPDEIAGLILGAIERDGLQPGLESLPGPEEFLEIIAGSNVPPDRAGIVFDRACCNALLGRHDEALRLLALADFKRRDQMELFPPAESDFMELALNERLSGMLKAGENITAELRRCCHANAVTLGFVPAPLPGP